MRWLSVLIFGFTVMAGGASAQQVAIATGGPGGVYHPLGVGIADVLNKHLPGVTAVARVTGGSIDNLKMIGAQKSDIALTMADAALDALNGRGKFKSAAVAVRTLMVLYPNRMHVVTLDRNGIATMADLKGKRVATGSPGSATELMAARLLDALGFDRDKDLHRERLGVADAVQALKEGRIDALFWVGGLPTAAIAELAASPGIRIRLIDQGDAVAAMNRKYGALYKAGVIPANTYPGQDQPTSIVLVQNILIADASLPDQVAYDVVRTLIERRDELIAVHGEAQSIALDNQSPKNSPVPWHPGAAKYFKSKGVAM